MNTRRTELSVLYEGKDISEQLSPYLMAWTYTDNLSGQVDDICITLEDRATRWLNSWMPSKGSTLKVSIIKKNWEGYTGTSKKNIGKFEIDTITAAGEPTEVTIAAMAVPESAAIRKEQKSKAWENATLKKVAGDIAAQNKMKLIFKSSDTQKKDRYEQDNETDLQFLRRLCNDEGLCLKISNKNLVILDEADYEGKKESATITRDNSGADKRITVKEWQAISTICDVYKSCRVEHTDKEKKKAIKATFSPPKAPKTGKTLVIKQDVKTHAEALRLAKKSLREKNKEANKINLTVLSTMHIDAGMTFRLARFGKFNGKYIAYTVIHSGGQTKLSLRKCLEGY